MTPTGTVVPGATVRLESQQPSVIPWGLGTVLVVHWRNQTQTITADSNGQFQFGSVPKGTYAIVADVASMPTTKTPSNVTIAVDIQVTSSGGPGNLTIPLVAESGSAALIEGLFSTASASLQGATIKYSVQAYGTLGPPFVFLGYPLLGPLASVPFFTALSSPATAVITTGPSPGTNCSGSLTCPIGTFCACYLIGLPGDNPVIGVADSSGAGYFAVPPSGQADYVIDAAATVIGSSNTADCSPSGWVTPSFAAASGVTTTAPEIDFTGCN